MRQAGHATRKRLLEAARQEFTEYGVAGARINRIASAARASKERLYTYFPSKEALFAEVIRLWLLELDSVAQPAPADMPGYVGRLFDHFAQNPLDSRLSAWMQLEFGDEAPPAHTDLLSNAIKAVGEGQAQGAIDPEWDPFDLVMLLVGVAHTMATTGLSTRGLGVERSQVTTQRRAAAVEAARRLIDKAPS
ncbi:TetR/AcrR family transcriptional regulator [Streptomyces phaeochromogenes]